MYYDQHGNRITQATFYALKGAAMRKLIGRWACDRFVVIHGSTLALLRLALQLQRVPA